MNSIFNQLLRSTSFRLALTFTFLYLLCITLGAIFFYFNVQDRINSKIESALVERHSEMGALYLEHGIAAVVQLIDSQRNNPMVSELGYQLRNSEGIIVAGNILEHEFKTGIQDIPGVVLGHSDEENYRFLSYNLGPNKLSVGHSLRLLEEMKAHSIASLFITLTLTTLLTLAGGLVLARRSQARIRSIAGEMDNFSVGKLDVTLPVSHRGDDIDRLAGNMNGAIALLGKQVDGMKQVSVNLAHDLKTPLNRLCINIEEARDLINGNKQVQERLDAASKEAKTIDATFESLLRIAQLQAGHGNSRFNRQDLRPMLTCLVDVFAPVATENQKYIKLYSDESATTLPVNGDKKLLQQMLCCILDNAVTHTPTDSTVSVNCGIKNNRVRISVADMGPGIPEDQRTRVFEPLYRLESSRTSEGMGTGLSIAQAIAELHGGIIDLDDNNPGLLVSLSFPVFSADAEKETSNRITG